MFRKKLVGVTTIAVTRAGAMMVAAMLLLSAACGGERKTESKAGETKTAEAANVETETQAEEIAQVVTEISPWAAEQIARLLKRVPEQIDAVTRERFIGKWQSADRAIWREFHEDGRFALGTVSDEWETSGTWKIENNVARRSSFRNRR